MFKEMLFALYYYNIYCVEDKSLEKGKKPLTTVKIFATSMFPKVITP